MSSAAPKNLHATQRRDTVVYADVIYTFIFKKSFKYLKNFNETAADSSTHFQIPTAPFFFKFFLPFLNTSFCTCFKTISVSLSSANPSGLLV